MKEGSFRMMAIHPRFAADEIEMHISLTIESFHQPSGIHMQHHSLLNDLLLKVVPFYAIPNIQVYRPVRIWLKPFNIPYRIVSYTIFGDICWWRLPQVHNAGFANLGILFLHQVVELLPTCMNMCHDRLCLLAASDSLMKHIYFHLPLHHDLDELVRKVPKIFECISTLMPKAELAVRYPLLACWACQRKASCHPWISSL